MTVAMKTRGSILLLLGASLLVSCSKVDVQGITEAPPGSARIMYFNDAVGAPSVNFYANGTKTTAIGPSNGGESPIGITYGNVAAGGYYTDIQPGQYTITGQISPTATTDGGKAISSVATTLAAGTYYSFYQSGIYDATNKAADAFVVQDPLPDFDWSQAYVRLVNASSNSSPMALSLKNTTTAAVVPAGGAVAYRSAGTFTPVAAGTYDLSVRVAGATSDAITRTGVSFAPGRVYTVTARGDMTVTSTTSASRPILDFTPNR